MSGPHRPPRRPAPSLRRLRFGLLALLLPLLAGANPAHGPGGGSATLTTARGAVPGHSAHGVEHGGDSWTFEAPADGWYRFEALGEDAEHAVTLADDTGELVSSSRWRADGRALIHAQAGSVHRVSVGAPGGGGGGFTLQWSRQAGPAGLRLAGRLADGGRDARGAPVEVRRPGELAFGGGRLFLASGLGLTAFGRDAATGALARVRHEEGDLSRASLAWDAARGRLLVHDCGDWRAAAVGPGGAVGGLADVEASGGPGGCGRLLLDAAGGLVHRIGDAALDTFALEADGSLRFEGTVPVPGLKGAAVGEPGRVYAAGGGGLLLVERDQQTGRFAAAPLGVDVDASGLARVPLAHDAGTGRLLAVDAGGARLLPLRKGQAPVRLPLPDNFGTGLHGCAFAAVRPDSTADVFCDGAALSLGADGRATAIALPEGGAPVGTAASRDGRHVYVSTRAGELLTFERVLPSSSDDHGDGQATATRVAVPSTTAGYLDAGERDYFRVDLDEAGSFTAETTGSTDTWGFIEYGEHGFVLADSDDDGEGENFRIESGRLEAGTYYVVVEGFSPSTRGSYSLVLSAGGGATPAAQAPAVSIDAVPAGDEGAAVRLGAALTGGAYDGAPEYAWRVTGGALDNPSSATPAWTRPSVGADTSHAVRLTVTVRGAGTNARNGTSDTARASRTALVRDVAQLPAADAPSVSIDAIPAGDEGAAVRLGATLTGGTYDGAPEYAWTVTGGALNDPASATPTWTRPSVTSNTSFTVRLAVTARGAGANARNGTSDTARASRSALVRDTAPQLPAADAPGVSIDAIPAGDEGAAVRLGATLTGGAYDGAPEYAWTVTGGALNDPASATPTWTRPPVTADTSHTVRLAVTARGTGANARNGTSDAADASRSALVRDVAAPLPAASAPTVSINAIADGDEGTAVTLGAALAGGAYDGAPEYDWDVSGGALDDDTSAAPIWTRPAVTSNASFTVSLTVTVNGAGTAARNGTSDTGSADRAARVLDAAPPPPSSCVDDAKWRTVADYYDHNATRSPNYGANWYRVLIAYRQEDPERTLPAWQGATAQPTAPYTASEAETGEAVWFGWTPVREVLECLERAFPALPAAAAPAVSVDAVAAGDEGTKVGLSATLAGGTYDGSPEYAWTVTGGALDDAASATPEWTRPTVAADGDHTVSLIVTVRGAGTNARNGTSATANASLDTRVRDVAAQLPAASAPAVSVDAVPAGDEGTKVTLGATLTGGAYDGAAEYAWRVTGGALDDPASATPDWTRPAVGADTDHTVSLAVTVRGAGANARNGTSDTASASLDAQVRDVPAQLPAAAAPSVSIDAIAAGDGNTPVTLGATLAGGAYDGAPEYAWSVTGGRLDDPASATPTWTRPAVSADANHTVSLTVTVHGAGTSARNGTSATANASRDAQVRDAGGDHGDDRASAAPIAIPSTTAGNLTHGDRDYFRLDIATAGTLTAVTTGGTDTYGTLFDGGGNQLRSNDDGWQGRNFRIVAGTLDVGTYYLEVRGYRASTTGDYTLSVEGSARVPAKPAAAAPAVTINAVAAGDENTAVPLGATLTGGTYDGTPQYAWSVSGGDLSDRTSATPAWTRPPVTADTDHTVGLAVTVRGAGANARNGTSDTANASLDAEVRNVAAQLPAASAPTVSIDAIADGDEGTDVGLGATVTGGLHDGALEYAWQVDGGALNDPASATPTWTRPSVAVDTSYTVRLTVTARGTGTTARNGTSAAANASASAQVRDVAAQLPAADAPAVAIDAVAAGDEGTAVGLGATLTGGAYDGNPEYAWSVTGGALSDSTSPTPTWTRPDVSADTDHTVGLAVTVHGAGTAARTGTSDTANASRTAQVRDAGGDHGDDRASAAPIGIPSTTAGNLTHGDRDYFRIEIATAGTLTAATTGGTDTYGTLFDGDGRRLRLNDDDGQGHNFRIRAGTLGAGTYYLEVRGFSPSKTGDYTLSVTGTARGPGTLPAAAAPAVAINAVAAGDEDTAVGLSATLTGGTYDGSAEYAWSVTGGALNDATLATPTWTRPAVAADTNHTVRLRVTARGTGTVARNGTSATANASASAQVRNVATALPAAAAPAVTIDAIADGDEGTAVGLGATVSGGAYDGALEYAWQVDGGALNDPASATPTWTRPAVTTDTNHTVRLRVTARGTGTTARNGTSATANASRGTLVRNVAQLPVAAAPTVSIDAVAAGDEGTAVDLSATVTGGTYDGALEYAWQVDGGALNNSSSATPTWTLPTVASDTGHTVRLTVTARGTGTLARDNTSDTVSHSVPLTVRNTPQITVTTLVSGLSIPWDIDFTPDGTMLFTERAGKLSSRLTNGTVQAVSADFSDVFNQFESGLMAIVVDPDFATNRRFYTCQAHTGPEVQVIAWTINSGYTTATRVADPLVGGIPASSGGRHSGCRLRFGPDGHLWIATGDAATGTVPQDLNSLGGKVLRVNASTGAGATGNPLSSTPLIYTYGHRNPQGLALRPGTREMWMVEHGPTRDDEINLLAAGGNYGWDPVHAGDPNNPYFEGVPMTFLQRHPNAVAAKWSSGSSTLAVSGGIFLEGDRWGAWEGRLAVASLKDQSLRLFEFSAYGDLLGEVNLTQLHRAHGRLRTPMLGPDGALYVTTSNGSGDRILRVAPPATTPADAPTVSIDAIADGDEGATVQLAATLAGGTYDGALEYAWSVNGGRLDDPTLATPTWTRPTVTSNTSYAVRLAVTARGTGTNAASGTSDTENASRTALVRNNTTQQLPLADAPTVTIDEIPIGTENTVVRLGATLDRGTYDELEYEWSVDGGTLNDSSAATPKWTRPAVTANTTQTVRLTVTARGTGANARNGSSSQVSRSRTATVRDAGADHGNSIAAATQVTIPGTASGRIGTVGDKDFFRIDVRLAGTLVLQTTGATDTVGVLYDSDGTKLHDDDDSGAGRNFRIATSSLAVGVYYLEVRGHANRIGHYVLSVTGTANDDEGAGAPLVSIDLVPAGFGGTTAGLRATLTAGIYDGTPEYAWSVSGGRLDAPASATPTWTRPSVTANATHTVELTVTVHGIGVNAPAGTSESVSASQTVLVRVAGADHGNLREHATVVSVPGTESGRLTYGDEDYFRFTLASQTRLSIWTTGSTDTAGQLFDRNGSHLTLDGNNGSGQNFRLDRDLAAGDYFVRVWLQSGDASTNSPYTLELGERPNSPPTVIASELPGAQQATAGGAPLLWALPTHAFADSDHEYVWVEPSSSNQTVATVALEGGSVVVYPRAAGSAIVTATARDPSGASTAASFSVDVSATTTPTPTASFNAAGDTLTLSFTEQFAAGETRAYQSRVQQSSPRDGWRSFCGTVTNAETTAETENVELDLSPNDFFEPGVRYEAVYRYVGSSCSDNQYGQWSVVAEATAPGTASFDIDLVFVGSPTTRVRNEVEAAVQTWERVITMGLQNIDFSSRPLSAGTCIDGSPAMNDVVDDVRLLLKIESIDGPGGTLGTAGVCYYRSHSGLPILGGILLDSADVTRLSDARLRSLVLHEIGHTLGFSGQFFYRHSLMRQPSLRQDRKETLGSPDTHFAGPSARAAFDAAGGSAYPSRKVPLENTGGIGSRDGHWRENVLRSELMTPILGAGANPMSAITIQAMADLGYQVDVSQADSYRLPGSRSSLSDSARLGAQQGEVEREILGTCTVKGTGTAYDDSQEDRPQPSAARLRPVGVQ